MVLRKGFTLSLVIIFMGLLDKTAKARRINERFQSFVLDYCLKLG